MTAPASVGRSRDGGAEGAEVGVGDEAGGSKACREARPLRRAPRALPVRPGVARRGGPEARSTRPKVRCMGCRKRMGLVVRALGK